VVKTVVKAKDKEGIPIDYKLIKEGDQWLVYDVVIEGVSLVNNYRNQFNKIISAGFLYGPGQKNEDQGSRDSSGTER